MSLAGVKLSFFLPFQKSEKKTQKNIMREGGKALLPILKLKLNSEKFVGTNMFWLMYFTLVFVLTEAFVTTILIIDIWKEA